MANNFEQWVTVLIIGLVSGIFIGIGLGEQKGMLNAVDAGVARWVINSERKVTFEWLPRCQDPSHKKGDGDE